MEPTEREQWNLLTKTACTCLQFVLEYQASRGNGKKKKYRYMYTYIHVYMYICCCLVAQSCPAVCDPMDCSPPGSYGHGVSQATGVGCHFQPGLLSISCITGGFFFFKLSHWESLYIYMYVCITNPKGKMDIRKS